MKINQDTHRCYVFSPATVELAVQEWVDSKIKSDLKEKEKLQICTVALPWFLEHIQHNASIYMFTHENLLEEIELWKKEQLECYPKQKERIDITCDLIMCFFQSDVVINHKMIIEA